MKAATEKLILITAVVAATVVLVASGEKSGSGDSQSNSPAASSATQNNGPNGDVEIATCTTDSMGQLSATVKITNNSSKASNYIITVVFETSDGATQIDSTFAAANNLEPGQNATADAYSFKDAPAGFKCRITDVTRYAS
ncbi:unannotated protein [freshwater metagenome]|uniref:Unannotated protein n=1 Tax=freshwater metagenome TaxID=449393 RepID=A0A6J7FFS1_9ZZZZ|nr:hypothetical protein [Actinomycetota bacterium]